jgi:hypothetical protein
VDISLVAMQVFFPLEILAAVIAPEWPVRLLTQVRHLVNQKKHEELITAPGSAPGV